LHVGDVDTEARGKACGEDDAAATMAASFVVPDCVFDGETDAESRGSAMGEDAAEAGAKDIGEVDVAAAGKASDDAGAGMAGNASGAPEKSVILAAC
jgi:hypothetical protein